MFSSFFCIFDHALSHSEDIFTRTQESIRFFWAKNACGFKVYEFLEKFDFSFYIKFRGNKHLDIWSQRVKICERDDGKDKNLR